jgi:ribosomal protein S18 acetylase RimI-like enzyme
MNILRQNSLLESNNEYSFRALDSEFEVDLAYALIRSVRQEDSRKQYRGQSLVREAKPEAPTCLAGTSAIDQAWQPGDYWFGAFDDERMVACVRVTRFGSCIVKDRIEMPAWLHELEPCELSCLVVHPQHRRRKSLIIMMMRMAVDYAFENSSGLCIASENSRLGDLYEKMGMQRSGLFFRYHESDRNSVEMLYFDDRGKGRYDTPLYRLSDRYIVDLIR